MQLSVTDKIVIEKELLVGTPDDILYSTIIENKRGDNTFILLVEYQKGTESSLRFEFSILDEETGKEYLLQHTTFYDELEGMSAHTFEVPPCARQFVMTVSAYDEVTSQPIVSNATVDIIIKTNSPH